MNLHDSPSSAPPMSFSYCQYKLQQASVVKAKGTQSFKNKHYEEAIKEYKKAINILEPASFYSASPAEQSKMVQLRSSTFFNIGLSSFNIQRWRDAEQNFDEAIKLNPYYAKAYFKRGLVKLQKGEKESGFKDIQNAYTLDPRNSEIQGQYFRIAEVVESEEKLKQQSARNKKQQEKQRQQKQELEKKKKQQIKQTKIDQKSKLVGFWVFGLVALAGVIIYKNIKKY